MILRLLLSLMLVLIAGIAMQANLRAEESRGLQNIQNREGQTVGTYGQSYALLIGVGDYTAGWPDLPSVFGELDQVERLLQHQGFQITRVDDPGGSALRQAFNSFINAHGWDPDNRLLIFFSGHGHTRQGLGKNQTTHLRAHKWYRLDCRKPLRHDT